MLLRSIHLKNFRQYKGEQNVIFSCESSRNVTVILGDNTSGKTTLLQAFNWALYGQSSFTTKDILLNVDVSREMSVGDVQTVEVEVCLNHDNTEYIVTRTQDYVCDSKGVAKPAPSKTKISYKSSDGQTETIRTVAIEDTIDKILPSDLSSYFFFDGERIENISNKKDVTDAVKGLLGLTVLDNALKHLEPSRKNSVIGRFNSSMDLTGNQKATDVSKRIQSQQERLRVIGDNLGNVRNQINYYEQRKMQLEETIRENQQTARLQQDKERLEKDVSAEEKALEAAYGRLIADFNNNPSLFFAKPLMTRAVTVLRDARLSDKGIPNMNATSIDFIITRGRCVCGAEVCEGTEAYEHLLQERTFLPPQSIGTILRNFNQQITSYSNISKNYVSSIQMSYADIYRFKTRIREWNDEIQHISIQIQGRIDMQKYEIELNDVKVRLKKFYNEKEGLLSEEGACKNDIGKDQKLYNTMIGASEKNKQIIQYIRYTEAVYEWIRGTYESKENEIRELLETKVSEFFTRMYHGKRKVVIDNKYRVTLLTALGDEEIRTDESRGLETVKNFAFICGLVDVARGKIHNNLGDTGMALSTEPFPLVMDAPFSNADEKHVSAISRVLPEIAEQVIMIVMEKDWGYAEKVMGERVGKKYTLDKKSETLTYVKEYGA